MCQCMIIHGEESHPLSKHVPEHTHCPRSLCYHIISFEGVWNIVPVCLLSCRETASSCSLAMEPISHLSPPVTPPTFCYHGGYHVDAKSLILGFRSNLPWHVADISYLSSHLSTSGSHCHVKRVYSVLCHAERRCLTSALECWSTMTCDP